MLSSRLQSQLALLTPPAGAPEILNGTFDDGSNWVLTQGGGAGTIAISGGVLNFTSGSAGVSCNAVQTLVGLVPGNVYTLTYDVVSSMIGFAFFQVSLGGGTEVAINGNVGTGRTIMITAGATNNDIKIRGNSNLANRGGSIDNLILS